VKGKAAIWGGIATVAVVGSAIFYVATIEKPATSKGEKFPSQPVAISEPQRLPRAPLPASNVQIDSTDLASDYDRVSSVAKTDPTIAYGLALALAECQQLAARYEGISEVNDSAAVSPKTTESMLDSADAAAARCKGLSEDQLASQAELLERAAEAGVLDAQLNYSTILASSVLSPSSIARPEKIIEYKKKSIDYLNRAALAGEPKALLQLGLAYQDGILADKSASRAYAYTYAYGMTGASKRTGKLLTQMEAGLSAAELARARAEGEALYRRCCR